MWSVVGRTAPTGISTHLFRKQLHADGTTTQNIPGKESDKVTPQTDVIIPTHCSRGETSLNRFMMEKNMLKTPSLSASQWQIHVIHIRIAQLWIKPVKPAAESSTAEQREPDIYSPP